MKGNTQNKENIVVLSEKIRIPQSARRPTDTIPLSEVMSIQSSINNDFKATNPK